MKLEIIELEDQKAKFTVEGIPPYFVNALRRVLQAEVPKLAIDNVTFYDNTSALFDEMVAHRLSLLPVPTDPSTLNRVDEVDDEGNPAYLVRYTLTKEGPGMVYSGDLECEDKAFAIVDPKVPIVELLEDQRLILEATAILGRGTDHAKWQVAQAVGYKYWPTATVDNGKIPEELRKVAVETTPNGILGLEGNKLVVLQPENVNRADDVERMVVPSGTHAGKKLADIGAFKVEYNDRKFIFRFETDGSLKAEDALLKAVELLKERFKAFGDAVEGL